MADEKTFKQKIFNVTDKIDRIRTNYKENGGINVSKIIDRERMHRFKDLSHMPKVTPKKALDSFKILDDGKTDYPMHIGELYLERHQGTYTTQSKNKKYNRKCEFALKN